jgi:hypothetical protein
MKTSGILFGGLFLMLAAASPGEGPGQHKYSNSRYAAPTIPKETMPDMVIGLPASAVRGWEGSFGSRDDWRGGWRRLPGYVIEEGVGGDYYFARPAGARKWKPDSVYSRAWGKVVPYPVDYSGLPGANAVHVVSAGEPASAITRIEPVEKPASTETLPARTD